MSVRVRPLAQLDFSRREKPHFTGAFFIDLWGIFWSYFGLGTKWGPTQNDLLKKYLIGTINARILDLSLEGDLCNEKDNFKCYFVNIFN
mgnify:CR=1 FL=1